MALRRSLVAALAAAAMLYSSAAVAQLSALVYKSPWCGCCTEYVAILAKNGYDVTVRKIEELGVVKRSLGVPQEMESCHTMVVGGYVVEGHVPLAAIDRLLAEKPDVIGIALPGMPQGSPGMNGDKEGPFEIYAITKAGTTLYMVL